MSPSWSPAGNRSPGCAWDVIPGVCVPQQLHPVVGGLQVAAALHTTMSAGQVSKVGGGKSASEVQVGDRRACAKVVPTDWIILEAEVDSVAGR